VLSYTEWSMQLFWDCSPLEQLFHFSFYSCCHTFSQSQSWQRCIREASLQRLWLFPIREEKGNVGLAGWLVQSSQVLSQFEMDYIFASDNIYSQTCGYPRRCLVLQEITIESANKFYCISNFANPFNFNLDYISVL
jgi:hypothetical protein